MYEKKRHPANGYYNFFNKQDVSGTRIFSLYLNSNGSGNYYIHEGSSIQYNGTVTALSTNTWYMITYVFDRSSSISFYCNGVKETITGNYPGAATGAVTNAEVLAAIVKLIASINKQIRALQKSLKR